MNTLRDWEEWIDEQTGWLSAHHAEHRFPADPARTRAWLEGESLLVSAPLQRAVRHFAETDAWPELSPAEAFHLALRLHLGGQAVEEWMRPEQTPAKAALPAPPDPSERAAFLRWFLMDVWDTLGGVYLSGWITNFMRENPATE